MNREERYLRELDEELHAPDAPGYIKDANKRWKRWSDRWLDDRQSGYADNVASFRDRLERRRNEGR